MYRLCPGPVHPAWVRLRFDSETNACFSLHRTRRVQLAVSNDMCDESYEGTAVRVHRNKHGGVSN